MVPVMVPSRHPLHDERGVAVVESAFVIPLLMMLLLGMISAGTLYNQQLQLTHATREGARYGATVPADQAFNKGTWADNVRELVIERSAGELTTAEQVCVSLVEGEPPVPLSADHTTQADGSACFDDSGGGESGARVQVRTERPGELDAMVLRFDLTLDAKATARHES